MSEALCIGQHDLFDSTDPADHEQAARLCAACPIAAACAQALAEAIASTKAAGHPEGTWAGRLVLNPRRDEQRRLGGIDRAERVEREEAMFTADEARRAHSAYCAGDRGEWARAGHRTYDRRRWHKRVAAA